MSHMAPPTFYDFTGWIVLAAFIFFICGVYLLDRYLERRRRNKEEEQ